MNSQCFWPAHAPHSTTQIMKNVQYLCIFNDSEPAHAPHSTKQIMKNARIPFYLQWFWACPCPPFHHPKHEKCMETTTKAIENIMIYIFFGRVGVDRCLRPILTTIENILVPLFLAELGSDGRTCPTTRIIGNIEISIVLQEVGGGGRPGPTPKRQKTLRFATSFLRPWKSFRFRGSMNHKIMKKWLECHYKHLNSMLSGSPAPADWRHAPCTTCVVQTLCGKFFR